MKKELCSMGFALGLAAVAAAGCGDAATASTGSGGSGGESASGTVQTGGSGGAGAGGASTGGSTGSGGAGTGGTGTAGGGACDGYQGLATVAQIAASPFANKEAEVLALEASGKVVAPKDVYERITSDLALIRGQSPQLQTISAMPSWAADQMLVGFDAEGLAAIEAGTYTDWDCPNALYDVTKVAPASFYVLVTFAHRFNVPLLAAEYAALPHAEYAEPNGFLGDGNDVCVSIGPNGTYHYVFDAGSGDCQAGCIDHTYWGFDTESSPGAATALGTFSKGQGQEPAWFTALGTCTQWL